MSDETSKAAEQAAEEITAEMQAVLDTLKAVRKFTDVLQEIDPLELKAYIEAKYPALFPAMYELMGADTRLAIHEFGRMLEGQG